MRQVAASELIETAVIISESPATHPESPQAVKPAAHAIISPTSGLHFWNKVRPYEILSPLGAGGRGEM